MGKGIGGLVNTIMGGPKGGEGVAEAYQAVQALQSVGVPSVEAQRIVLETPELVGELLPLLEQAEELGPSALEGIEIPDELKTAQMSALSTLQEVVDEGGLSPADRAELNKVRREVEGRGRAADARILESMAERGVLGSGLELASRQAQAQQAQQAMAEAADRQAAMAFQNKMGALDRLGSMGTQMRGQEFGEQSNVARAKDEISRFNLANRAAAQQRNIDRQNMAQAQNLSAKQAQENLRASLANQQEMHNKGLLQQQFQNEIQRAGGVAQGYQGVGQAQQQTAANKAAMVGSILGGASEVGGAAIGKYSDINLKENIQDGDQKIENMMDNIDAYEYDYKPEIGGEQDQVSVMAQDLEKSELGSQFVEDTDMGKMVDYGKAMPTMMAGQANLNRRLRRLEKLLNGEGE